MQPRIINSSSNAATPNPKINIAVIGAGTGLTAAWALENQREFNVTVCEAQDKLGGHIRSMIINGVQLEGGAEFIGNPDIYPNVHKLFKILNVELVKFELNMEFHDLTNPANDMTLPPVLHTSSGSCKPSVPQPDSRVDLKTLACHMHELINFYKAIQKAKIDFPQHGKFITLEQFIYEFKSSWINFFCKRGEFADKVLYPVIAAGWGVPINDIKKFGAHYALHYLSADNEWYDAPEGLSTYIEKMADQCANTTFNLNTEIKKLIPVIRGGKLKYQLLKKDDTYISDADGYPAIYDDVILATPAYVTSELIADINTTILAEFIASAPLTAKEKIVETINEIEALHARLSAVKYYDTTVVFHQDPDYQSNPKTVVHTRYDGRVAANTMCKRWKFSKDETPVMKTWVLPNQTIPKNIHEVVHYKHPVMDKSFYDAQIALHHAQAKLNLHFGGILAGFNDAHESGISVSLEIAARICERENCLVQNERLALFNSPQPLFASQYF